MTDTLSQHRSRTTTARELVESGRCTATCLLAEPSTISDCVCQCLGAWHGGVAHSTATTNRGY